MRLTSRGLSADLDFVTRPGNFHLTLSFLANVEHTCIKELGAQLQEGCEGIKSFHIVCQGIGYFPTSNRPRVLWGGVNSPRVGLTSLQSRVAAVCSPFAERPEKGCFHGHITLGRISPNSPLMRGKLEGEIERASVWGEWNVDEVQLVSSDLSQGTPKYSILRQISLQ